MSDMVEVKTQYGNPDINQMMEAFTNFIGLEPTPKKQQRQYCSHVIRATKGKTMDVVNYAISIQGDYYAPSVTSPKDLYYNLSKVMAYYKKQEAETGSVITL